MKNKNIFDLDPERLSTTDEFGNRIYVHPENVKGFWKNWRTLIYWVLLVVYLSLPWINIGGKPALQMDIFQREFTFLGSTLYGVEPVLMFLALITLLFLFAFLTSVFGRVWCGWACPQTVFIQAIFLKIESLIEGSPKKRRDLDAAPWTSEKCLKRFTKWFIFTIISLHIAHTFIGYIVGPRTLLSLTLQNPSENWGLFVATMILTGIFLFDFGWFREQFCIIMCPYGRIQSVMMDENSLVVAYDKQRGEPRFGNVPRGEEGDCVNCYHCVKVCPTGIDIRRGTQLECIHCTQCIDACDAIMEKLKRPPGLIKYASENGKKHRIFTRRSMAYSVISLVLFSSLIYLLSMSGEVKMVFLRSRVPFRVNAQGLVMNNFQLKLTHQGQSIPRVEFQLQDPMLRDDIELITPAHPTILDEAEEKIVFIFRFPPSLLQAGQRQVVVETVDQDSGEVISKKEVNLVGPVD